LAHDDESIPCCRDSVPYCTRPKRISEKPNRANHRRWSTIRCIYSWRGFCRFSACPLSNCRSLDFNTRQGTLEESDDRGNEFL